MASPPREAESVEQAQVYHALGIKAIYYYEILVNSKTISGVSPGDLSTIGAALESMQSDYLTPEFMGLH